MNDFEVRQLAQRAIEEGEGVLRLVPAWVPRSFCVPGRRLRLHPNDLYALGAHRGGIDERWFSSTVAADNGPGTPFDEGMSYVYTSQGKFLLRDAIGLAAEVFLGAEAARRYGGWVMYSKFFDNMYPLPHHIHHSDERAADVGRVGKPEAYYFPAQYNFALNQFPYTFFGLNPGTSREQVIDCLKRWGEGDNGILGLSRAHKLELETGWYVPPGVLHAPGTLCTYEPQRASDVFSMWQSLVFDQQVISREMLVKDVPQDKQDDYDYLMSLLDWDANVAPDFAARFFRLPIPATTLNDCYNERWITYGSDYFSAKELSVKPGHTVRVREPAAYGLICIQGHGRFGKYLISSPNMIRFGEMTEDEFFVTAEGARRGVTITNLSETEPLVMLKHFNPGHPEMPRSA